MTKSRNALLVIDMQRHFQTRNASAFSTLIPNVQRLIASARAAGLLVVHVLTEYSPDKSDWPLAWRHRERLWCMRGSPGAELLPEVEPLRGEPVIVKTRFSAFFDTALNQLLRQHDIERILFCGFASDVCVRLSAVDAYNRNYFVTIYTDCTSPETEDPLACTEYLRRLTNATVGTLETIGLSEDSDSCGSPR